MSKVSVRMFAMILTVLGGAMACRAGSADCGGGRGMFLGNSGGVSACEGRGQRDLRVCGRNGEESGLSNGEQRADGTRGVSASGLRSIESYLWRVAAGVFLGCTGSDGSEPPRAR